MLNNSREWSCQVCVLMTHSTAVSPSLSFMNDFLSPVLVLLLEPPAEFSLAELPAHPKTPFAPSSASRLFLSKQHPGQALSLEAVVSIALSTTQVSPSLGQVTFFTCSDIGLSNEKVAPLVARNKILASSLQKTYNQL